MSRISLHRSQCLACTLWAAYPWDKLPSVVSPKLSMLPAEDKEGNLIRNAKWAQGRDVGHNLHSVFGPNQRL